MRTIMHAVAPLGREIRHPRLNKATRVRTALTTLGLHHEEHSDGHQKTGPQGLDLGEECAYDIYGSVEKTSSGILHMAILPTGKSRGVGSPSAQSLLFGCRNKYVVAHVYLDKIEKHGCTSFTWGSCQCPTTYHCVQLRVF